MLGVSAPLSFFHQNFIRQLNLWYRSIVRYWPLHTPSSPHRGGLYWVICSHRETIHCYGMWVPEIILCNQGADDNGVLPLTLPKCIIVCRPVRHASYVETLAAVVVHAVCKCSPPMRIIFKLLKRFHFVGFWDFFVVRFGWGQRDLEHILAFFDCRNRALSLSLVWGTKGLFYFFLVWSKRTMA